MKSKILLTLSLAAILLAACAPSGSLPMGDVELAVGESVSGEGVTVTFVEVLNDSRCPADAVCADAGFVEIFVLVSQDGSSDGHILSLGYTFDAGPTTWFRAGGHIFTLTEVNPYPLASDPTDFADYTITLNIGH